MKFLLSVLVAAMLLIGLAVGEAPNTNSNNNVIVIGKPGGGAATEAAPAASR